MRRSFVAWTVLVGALAGLAVTGCEEEIPRVGAGEYCQHDDQCIEGLVCLSRMCTEPPQLRHGPPTLEDAGPTPADGGRTDSGPPLDAGADEDAGAEEDAGTEMDAGDGDKDAGDESDAGDEDAGG